MKTVMKILGSGDDAEVIIYQTGMQDTNLRPTTTENQRLEEGNAFGRSVIKSGKKKPKTPIGKQVY